MRMTSVALKGGSHSLSSRDRPMWLVVAAFAWMTLSAGAATFHDFDNLFGGTPYTLVQNNNAPGPTIVAGGPTGAFLRLTTQANFLNNAVDFSLSDAGAFNQIIADFDFRITPGVGGAADGFGFALLNTANYGAMGAVESPGNVLYEEPNLLGSLGVGFDVYPSPGDINGNHVSIHFNGAKLQDFDAGTINLASGQWIHAKITMRPGNGFSDVSVVLTPAGGQATTILTNFVVQGFAPYEGRVHFGARTGGLNAFQDLDNINVQFANPQGSQFFFGFTNFTTVESAPAYIYVVRTNGTAGQATVGLAVSNITAVAGVDFTTPGPITFEDGEIIKYFTVPMINNAVVNASKTFAVFLTNAIGGTIGSQSNAVVTIVDDDNPAMVGAWNGVTNFPATSAGPGGVVPIHLNLLPNGKLVLWDRHGTNFGGTEGDPFIWDMQAGTFTKTPQLTYDLFCAGHALMSDGRLLTPGGHITDGDGELKTSIYDPVSNTWTRIPDMNLGRWYPTVTMLPTGDLLVEAGSYGLNGVNLNKTPQVWQPISGTWRYLNTAGAQNTGFPNWANYYPFMFLAPNGQVFCAGPQQMSRYLDTAGNGNWANVAASSISYRDYGTACLYDDGKVFMTGGNPHEPYFNGPFQFFPSRLTEVINLNDAQPAWRQVAPMFSGRRFGTATLLPDGKVLVTGGSSAPGFNRVAGAAYFAEMWDPITEQWTVLAAQTRPRGYHANALLLPDGRVMSTGGGHPNPVDGDAEPNAEFFSPPYLFKGARPTITSSPDAVTYGQRFLVATPDAANINSVTWLRIGNVTHNFDQNQRINRLAFTQAGGGISITAPSNPVLCPPGHYWMFILNANGVPSVSKVIQIGTGVTALAVVGADNQVTFTSVAGNKYQLERADAVLAANSVWVAVGAAVTAAGNTTTVTDAGAAAQPRRFYRVHQVP